MNDAEYLYLQHFCRQYQEWEKEQPATPERARRIAWKVQAIETALAECAGELADYVRLGVCYGWTYPQLRVLGIPCGKRKYYETRKRFYERLAEMV